MVGTTFCNETAACNFLNTYYLPSIYTITHLIKKVYMIIDRMYEEQSMLPGLVLTY